MKKRTTELRPGHGWAWMFNSDICNWASPTRERLLASGRPTPEAKPVKVRLVPIWRKWPTPLDPAVREAIALLDDILDDPPPDVAQYTKDLMAIRETLAAREVRIAELEQLLHEDDPDSWPPKIVGSPAQAYVAGLNDRLATLEAELAERTCPEHPAPDLTDDGYAVPGFCGPCRAREIREECNRLEAQLGQARAALDLALRWLSDGDLPRACGACGTPNANCDMDCVSAAALGLDIGTIRRAARALDAIAPSRPDPEAVKKTYVHCWSCDANVYVTMLEDEPTECPMCGRCTLSERPDPEAE